MPDIIKGDKFTDYRGRLSFVNDFDLQLVRRFYSIEHFDTNVVRAWQAHQIEQKWFYVTEGIFLVVLVKPDSWEFPSVTLPYKKYVLSAAEPAVLHIPGGFANGFKALQENSKMIVFSDKTLDESAADSFRFDAQLWYDWNS